MTVSASHPTNVRWRILVILMFAATVPVAAADTNAVLTEPLSPQQETQAAATAVAGAQEEGPEKGHRTFRLENRRQWFPSEVPA